MLVSRLEKSERKNSGEAGNLFTRFTRVFKALAGKENIHQMNPHRPRQRKSR